MSSYRKPPLVITQDDLDILERLIGRAASPTSDRLRDEIARAKIVPAGEAADRCRIGAWVSYEDLASGQTRRIQLVLPDAADIDRQKVSVLSPVGTALIGLKPGAAFHWRDAGNREHRLRVLEVGTTDGEGEMPPPGEAEC